MVYYPTFHTTLVFWSDRLGRAIFWFANFMKLSLCISKCLDGLREHKLTFRRILSWFTLELASCLCYLDPVDLRKSISGSEISRNQSFCIWYKKCIFANQKSMCVIRMKRKNQNKQPVWRNTWKICIASHSESFPRRILPCRDYL